MLFRSLRFGRAVLHAAEKHALCAFAYSGGFQRADYHAVFAKHGIGIFTHNLEIQAHSRVGKFRGAFEIKIDYPFEVGLNYVENLSVLQMLSQKHTEIRRRGGRVRLAVRYAKPRRLRRQAGFEFNVAPSGVYNKGKAVARRLYDARYFSADKLRFKPVCNVSYRKSVLRQSFTSF